MKSSDDAKEYCQSMGVPCFSGNTITYWDLAVWLKEMRDKTESKNQIKKRALSKLSKDEKEALGL